MYLSSCLFTINEMSSFFTTALVRYPLFYTLHLILCVLGINYLPPKKRENTLNLKEINTQPIVCLFATTVSGKSGVLIHVTLSAGVFLHQTGTSFIFLQVLFTSSRLAEFPHDFFISFLAAAEVTPSSIQTCCSRKLYPNLFLKKIFHSL